MKKFLYIGYYVEQSFFEDMIQDGEVDLSQARQNFEGRLLSEMNKHFLPNQWEIVSYLPETSRTKALKTTKIFNKKAKVFSISQTNILSQIRALFSFCKYLKKENFKNCDILMYSVHPVLSIPVFLLKKHCGFNVTTICSEIPQFRAAGNKISFVRKLKLNLQTIQNRKFDKYILFAEAMKDVIPVKKKPYVVIEGIAPEVVISPEFKKENIVMYAGGLGSQNNVELLIDACNASEAVDELWICGGGGAVEEIKKRAKGKIKYLGNLSSEEVLSLERKAKLLVNLRDPKIEITKYAFPSKILEYMASGTAVLSTNLQGIPKEYHSHINILQDLSIDSVKNAIEDILKMDEEDYVEYCTKAQNFVYKKKSAHSQAIKIIEFCTKMGQ